LFYVARPFDVRPSFPCFVSCNQCSRSVGKPHIPAPARHYFIAFIAEQPIGSASGVHKNLIAVPMAVPADATKATDVTEVSPHVSGDFGNFRRLGTSTPETTYKH
jgi:hypothetical protein